MKLLIPIFLLFSSTFIYSQNFLNGTSWNINVLFGIHNNDTYTLTKYDTEDLLFGNFMDFTDGKNFHSYNKAMCGNDCFYDVYGKYYFDKNNHIVCIIENVTNKGFCSKRMQEYYDSKVSFNYEIKSDTLILNRVE